MIPPPRRFLCCTLLRWTLTLGGLAIAVVAIAAFPLGLDIHPGMGPWRLILLALGLGAALVPHANTISERLGHARTSGREPEVIGDDPQLESPAASPRPAGLRLWLPLAFASLGIVALYGWFVAGGETARRPETTLYYDMLAEAFAAGQTHLKAVPNPQLADMRNPYDPAEYRHIPRCRQGQTSGCVLEDVTYYDGKYFFYWGPAPAVLLAPLKLVGMGTVSDSTLAFAGAISLFAFIAAFFALVWRQFFRQLPGWLFIPPLVLAGLAYPRPWVLDGSRIYEAAILHGAAFLMAGLVAAFPILSGGRAKPGRLALVGILWGLAFATRIVLIIPIAVFSVGLAWLVWRRHGSSSLGSRGFLIARLAFPITATVVLIALYNFDRFSNPLEFGWRYVVGFPGHAGGTLGAFRLASIPVNLYNYAFAPASLTIEPPYLRPVMASRSIGAIAIPTSDIFYGELITGLLFTTPFLVFAGSLIWWLSCTRVLGSAGTTFMDGRPFGHSDSLRTIVALVLAGLLAGSIPLLTNYAVTPRYLLDVSPLLIVLAGTGAWVAYAGATTRTSRAVIGLAILGTALASVVASVLLALNNWRA